jgi:DNA-binding NarL/FixJ family response regulator
MALQVLLAGPWRLTREALSALLEHSGEWRVAGTACGAEETVRLWAELRPDVAILEIGSPADRGLDAAIELGRCYPAAKRLALTGNPDLALVWEAIRSGVQSCLSLTASLSEFFNALRVVADGGSYISPEFSGHLRRSLTTPEPLLRSPARQLRSLNRREMQVLRLVAGGRSSRQIAVELGLSAETVRSYRKSLMRKLGVSGVARLVPLAVAAGLLDSSSGHAGSQS